MFKKILIANRGEIALRIIRTCKEMGIKTVAVYSTADKESLHVRFADEAVCIGPPSSAESYLSIPKIMAAVEITNADAIHPGYGFLAENADFAEVCTEYGIKFIGPTPKMIQSMGDKISAKETMIKAGVPVVPGSDGLLKNLKSGTALAKKIGYPIILKATAGGGGKGMRIVRHEEEFAEQWEKAKIEAKASFTNDGIYVEKFIEEPRHVEFQIIGDQYGTIIQVEHPVTEEAIGIDLIKEQIKVAAGEKLSGTNFLPKMVSMECRINAEDPVNDFRPNPGYITAFHSPKGFGVRVDTHVYAGYSVPPYYDSMIAKVICKAKTREECITRMQRALSEFILEGIKTTLPLHQQLMKDESFRSGNFNTSFIETFKIE